MVFAVPAVTAAEAEPLDRTLPALSSKFTANRSTPIGAVTCTEHALFVHCPATWGSGDPPVGVTPTSIAAVDGDTQLGLRFVDFETRGTVMVTFASVAVRGALGAGGFGVFCKAETPPVGRSPLLLDPAQPKTMHAKNAGTSKNRTIRKTAIRRTPTRYAEAVKMSFRSAGNLQASARGFRKVST
jgi:hypothetical protein